MECIPTPPLTQPSSSAPNTYSFKPQSFQSAAEFKSDNKSVNALIESTPFFQKKKKSRVELLDEKIRRLKEEEDLIASDPSVGAVPELVANRMLGRIVGKPPVSI